MSLLQSKMSYNNIETILSQKDSKNIKPLSRVNKNSIVSIKYQNLIIRIVDKKFINSYDIIDNLKFCNNSNYFWFKKNLKLYLTPTKTYISLWVLSYCLSNFKTCCRKHIIYLIDMFDQLNDYVNTSSTNESPLTDLQHEEKRLTDVIQKKKNELFSVKQELKNIDYEIQNIQNHITALQQNMNHLDK